MKDEIKEILNRFDFVKKEPNKLSYYPEDLLTREEMWLLYDCITNLQKEVRINNDLIPYLKNKEKSLKKQITNLQKENESLKEIVENLTTMTVCGDRKQIKNTTQYKLEIYKSRNEKAIEYINNKWKKDKYYTDIENCMTFCEYDKEDLLNILQGSDE